MNKENTIHQCERNLKKITIIDSGVRGLWYFRCDICGQLFDIRESLLSNLFPRMFPPILAKISCKRT